MKKTITLTSLAITMSLVSHAASAQVTHSWDVYGSFNSGPTNSPTMASPWIYGQRAGPGCAGTASALGFKYDPNAPSGSAFVGWQGVNTLTLVPLIAKNPGNSPYIYSTAQVPANSVWLHPGETGVNPVCAVVRFKAPMAGKFRVKGFFRSIDTGANSVNGYIFVNNMLVGAPIPISGPMGTQVDFDQLFPSLPNNATIDIAIDDGGSYYNDSTQLAMVISRCPPGKKDGPKGGGGKDDECRGSVESGGSSGDGDNGGGGGSLPVLSCSQSQNNPASVNLSTGQPGWTLKLPNGSASAIVPTPTMVPSPWTAVPGAQWVGPQGAPNIPGTYVYETQVKVLQCPNGRPAKLTAQFRADNRGTLNLVDPSGSPVATMNQTGTPNYGFLPASLSPASSPGVYSWTALANGIYTIRMTVQNSGGPTGVAANVMLTR